MSYGLLSAFCWGISTLLAALAARRIGALRTAVTAAVSSAYPVIPLIGGLLIFRERLMRLQVGGAMLILAGLVLLGFGS